MAKYGAVRIEGSDFLHYQELQVAQRRFAEVHDVHLHTLQQFAFAYTVERFQVHRPEYDSRNFQTVQVSGKFFCFYPFGGEHLERNGVTDTDGHIAQFTQNTADGIKECRVGMWNVGWRRYPLQSGLSIVHFTLPTFHFDDLQVALFSILQHLFTVQHQC